MIHLLKLVEEDEAADLLKELLLEKWETGKNTARGSIINKDNSQVLFPPASEWYNKLATLLFRNSNVVGHTRPRYLVAPMANSYTTGSYYDWHFDSPTMGSRRADMSFTFFLTPPDNYDGGELEIETDFKNLVSKGKAGEILIYPTEFKHRVLEVTNGQRTCIVGWIESWVKEPGLRADIFSLENIIKEVSAKDPNDKNLDSLKKVYRNMRRRAE